MGITDDFCFKMVANMHKPLTDADRISAMKTLRTNLKQYEWLVLSSHPVRQILYSMYNDKIKAGHRLSRFSRNFNMSVKGSNQELGQIIEDTIKRAFKAESEFPNTAPMLLNGLRLAFDLLMSDTVVAVLKLHALDDNCEDKALKALEVIRDTQETLFSSVVTLASNIASKKSQRVPGDVITYEDLLHEAVLAARDGVRSYRPNDMYDNAEEAAAAFTTYMYTWITGRLSNFEAEHSRTVKLPRTLIDRWGPVGEAIGQLDGGSFDDVAKLATKILHDKRQKTRGKKLARKEIYTADEVFELITAVQDIASLDFVSHNDGEESYHPSDKIIIADEETIGTDESVDKSRLNRKLTDLFHEYCAPDDFLLMSLRWGMGEVRGMQETANLFEKHTGRRIPKSKISTIERALFQKLRSDERAKDLMELIK